MEEINYARALMVNAQQTEKYTCKCSPFQGLFPFPWGYEVLIHKTLTQSAPTRLISLQGMNVLSLGLDTTNAPGNSETAPFTIPAFITMLNCVL